MLGVELLLVGGSHVGGCSSSVCQGFARDWGEMQTQLVHDIRDRGKWGDVLINAASDL